MKCFKLSLLALTLVSFTGCVERNLADQAYRDQFCQTAELGGTVTCTCDTSTDSCTGNQSLGEISVGDALSVGVVPAGGITESLEGSLGVHFRMTEAATLVAPTAFSIEGPEEVWIKFYEISDDGKDFIGGASAIFSGAVVELERPDLKAIDYLMIVESVTGDPLTAFDAEFTLAPPE